MRFLPALAGRDLEARLHVPAMRAVGHGSGLPALSGLARRAVRRVRAARSCLGSTGRTLATAGSGFGGPGVRGDAAASDPCSMLGDPGGAEPQPWAATSPRRASWTQGRIQRQRSDPAAPEPGFVSRGTPIGADQASPGSRKMTRRMMRASNGAMARRNAPASPMARLREPAAFHASASPPANRGRFIIGNRHGRDHGTPPGPARSQTSSHVRPREFIRWPRGHSWQSCLTPTDA